MWEVQRAGRAELKGSTGAGLDKIQEIMVQQLYNHFVKDQLDSYCIFAMVTVSVCACVSARVFVCAFAVQSLNKVQ